MNEPHPVDRPHLIATAAELAALAAAVEPDAPMFIGDAEIEPGSDPADHNAWAIVAQRQFTLTNEAGQVAGPGEQVSAPDEQGRHQLLTTPVLALTERRLATPGVVGPVAHPADPDIRRADAYHDRKDQDLTRYLMTSFPGRSLCCARSCCLEAEPALRSSTEACEPPEVASTGVVYEFGLVTGVAS